jgi:hypothetical protein
MIAAFLKTADGEFDYGAVIGSLLFAALIGLFVWMLSRALKTGRIPFGAGYMGSRIYWLERAEKPTGFWMLFGVYCLAMAFFAFTILALCFGLFHKPA